MNMLSRYLKERQNVDTIQNEYGFATYQINADSCYIIDIWVNPEFRNKNIASQIADEITDIAKKNGCLYILGSICPEANNSTDSLKVLLAYGMKLMSIQGNLIFFKKELI